MEWKMGEKADGSDSIAVQVAAETHWPEMRALILVVCLCVVLDINNNGRKLL